MVPASVLPWAYRILVSLWQYGASVGSSVRILARSLSDP